MNSNDRLLVIWKSDLTSKMKRSFFKAAVVSILLYGCTTWTLTKRMEKKFDGNYKRMLRAILNKSWRQHPTKQQLYGYQPPITFDPQRGPSSGATTSGQSGSGNDDNEGVLHIPQRFIITGTSPSDCLVSYLGHFLGRYFYPSAEKQSVYSTAPAD